MANQKEYTVSVLRANLAALILSIPFIVISVLVFVLFWPWENIYNALDIHLVYLLLVLIPGVFLHEFLHGLIWSIYAKNGWLAIKYGLKWSSLTPYCHCKDPLKKRPYVLGTIMPFIIMGLIPITISILLGSGISLIVGILFSISAGGDLYGIWLLRKAKRGQLIQDHPDEIGFIILENNN